MKLRICSPASSRKLRRTASDEIKPVHQGRSGPDAVERRQERQLLCAACGTPVARDADRITVQGAHAHRFTNPGGIIFHIGCFAEASHCTAVGEPTAEHTWFTGHAWRILVCRQCGTHLGWTFNRNLYLFYGLILDRLRYPH